MGNRAIPDCFNRPEALAAIGELNAPLVVFALRDRITGSQGAVRTLVMGIQQREGGGWEVLRDWEVIKLLNPIADKPRSQALGVEPSLEEGIAALLAGAQNYLESNMEELDLPFQLPVIESLACLIPGKTNEP